MRREDESHIVADGQSRIVAGYTAWLRALLRSPAIGRAAACQGLLVLSLHASPEFRSEEGLKESHAMYPGLFPKDFQFGRDDPIFANET
jgi:hypothetical protein